jgi:ketosteroid isomerase-like protein
MPLLNRLLKIARSLRIHQTPAADDLMEANQVRDIIERWAAGVRARDIDAVVSRHSADLLMFDVVEPARLQGLDAYRRSWLEQFFPWHGGTGRFDLIDLKVSAGVDVAFATALLECVGTEDGRKVAFTLRLTIGLEKRDGEWVVVHEHHSQPLDFDADRLD